MELAHKNPNLRDLRVAVVGLGRSGVAAARLAAAHGARVTALDRRPAADLGPTAATLDALGVAVHGDGHPPEWADRVDLVVLSPGVPATIPLVSACRDRGVPVWSEVELAWRFCRGRVIGVTGSNGKSTTTTMIGTILRGAGIPGGTGGNLATPFSELLDEDAENAVHAVELSSFQLETVDAFRADVAAILNLTPDHLDRYASFDDYADAKAGLLRGQESGDPAIVNADDPETTRFERAARERLHRFSVRGPVERGAFLDGSRLALRTDLGEETVLDRCELPVPGDHNVANALAAALACRLAGVAADRIADGLRAFRPLAHRLERIATVRGVEYYNDSKATNPDSTVRAALSFAPGSVLLILGGRDKGADWSALGRTLARAVRHVLLVGEASEAIAAGLGARVPVEHCGTIIRAIAAGAGLAHRGDVVLLSPGCASFDQYRNFEERGDDFRRAVLALRHGGEGGRA